MLLATALMSRPEASSSTSPPPASTSGPRGRLLPRLSALAEDPSVPPLVFVTHHVEEIPPGITHAALLRDGAMVASGPISEVLTGPSITMAFGVEVTVEQSAGRYVARAGVSPVSAPHA